jgi:hypothetical protein
VSFLVFAGADTVRSLAGWKWFLLFLFAFVGFVSVLVFIGVRAFQRSGTWDKEDRSWLDYGNLIIVALGLALGLIGFIVILLVVDLFGDKAKALGFLVALFGVITGLVGTYFGVKQSSDAAEGAKDTVEKVAGDRGNTTPTITIDPPTATAEVGQPHVVTATVTSIDTSPAANVAVTFKVTEGPDRNREGEEKTDQFGRATWSFTNNGTAGTDTIEAKALKATRTAIVKFTEAGQGSAREGIGEPEKGSARQGSAGEGPGKAKGTREGKQGNAGREAEDRQQEPRGSKQLQPRKMKRRIDKVRFSRNRQRRKR